MAEISKIEWTDSTWNPVTGCTKISPGCKYCYAETLAERWRGVKDHPYEQGFDLRLWPERLELPLRWKKSRRIFVNSMSDLFHPEVPNEFIDKVFETMRKASHHQFQVLTKRPERMSEYLEAWGEEFAEKYPHIWLGSSIENERYIERAQIVSRLPSSVRFLSCEPLLGPLDISKMLEEKPVPVSPCSEAGAGEQGKAPSPLPSPTGRGRDKHGINWVIVGGESGPRSRPMKKEWVIKIRNQCRRAKVPFFFKQWGGTNKKKAGRTLESRTWDEYPQDKQTCPVSEHTGHV